MEDKTKVELPADMAGWVELYRKTQADIKKLEEKLEQAKAKIQEAMGTNEVGLIDGRPVVRWTYVTATRLDARKAKEILPADVYGFLTTGMESRRFTLVEPDVNS